MKSKPIATIDCETDPFQYGRLPVPFIWDVYDGHKHYTFEHVSDCLQFLGNKEWIVYAHNGGKFDYHMPGFLNELEEFDEVMIINGRLAKFNIGLCEFRDSMNILPLGLAKLGTGKDSIDYAKLEKNVRHLHMAEIMRYLFKDTESLYEAVHAFRENYGSGLTLAGSAMKFWQARSKIKAPRSTRKFYDSIYPFYYGGRVQCFQHGVIDGPIHIVDINSAYPFAMLQAHPFSTCADFVKPSRADRIIPQSLYRVSGVSKGAFPCRIENSLRFPHDRTTREFAVTGWELQTALDTDTFTLGNIVERKDFVEMVEFSKYVNYFYDLKKQEEKGSIGYTMAKLMMNSLYGKFAANPDEYYQHRVVSPKNVPQTWCVHCDGHGCIACYGKGHLGVWPEGELGKWVLMREELEDDTKHYYNLATAASITGYVRAYLWSAIHAIQSAGGKVLYCDTDCIAFVGIDPGACALEIGKELGQWSYEGEFKRGGIAGRKLYAFECVDGKWKTASKGTRLSSSDIMEVARGGRVVYKSQAPTYNIRGVPTFLERTVKITK